MSVFFANFLLITWRDNLQWHLHRIGLGGSPMCRQCGDAERVDLDHVQRRECNRFHAALSITGINDGNYRNCTIENGWHPFTWRRLGKKLWMSPEDWRNRQSLSLLQYYYRILKGPKETANNSGRIYKFDTQDISRNLPTTTQASCDSYTTTFEVGNLRVVSHFLLGWGV